MDILALIQANPVLSLHPTPASPVPLHHDAHHATAPAAPRSRSQSRESKPRNRGRGGGSGCHLVCIFSDGFDAQDGGVGVAHGVWIGVLGGVGWSGGGGFAEGGGEDRGGIGRGGKVGAGCFLE
ncbi:hypothetical protein BGAL_0218g00150 [Botrytis galanthina]|uniref:Uncharacterized protein n=1 Tax=Botrytis galanthina TaxID=278940 RepID=A0A4S8QXY2_9HELO|nr:hypothetical protein BGAL_0218g00150 [Botrytis galanthina]